MNGQLMNKVTTCTCCIFFVFAQANLRANISLEKHKNHPMLRSIIFPAICLVLFATACTPKAAVTMGDGAIDWQARANEYKKNPAALQGLVESCNETEERANRLQGELSALRNQATSSQGNAQSALNEVASLRSQLADAQTQLSTARAALANRDEVVTDQAMVSGVIFRVQLGAFAENKVDGNLATGDALDLQDQNGLQKVVVAQYRTYANAQQLRDKLRKMGAKDAFIVAYQDGVRIEMKDALRITGQG